MPIAVRGQICGFAYSFDRRKDFGLLYVYSSIVKYVSVQFAFLLRLKFCSVIEAAVIVWQIKLIQKC